MCSCEKNNKCYSHSSCEKNNLMRLNKFLAHKGVCSRRKADDLIFAGKVKVNGKVEKNPATRISSDTVVEIDGKSLASTPEPTYVLLNKPVEVICSARDPQGRKTVMDFLPPSLKSTRLYPVGRLDYFSEGLLLLCNDGELAQRLAHPSHHQEKVYEVIIRGKVPPKVIEEMRNGMILDDGKQLLPVMVKSGILKNGSTMLTVTLRQGINRQIRKMCGQRDLTILSLKRVMQGPIRLGTLGIGKTRLLSPKEIKALRHSVGLES